MCKKGVDGVPEKEIILWNNPCDNGDTKCNKVDMAPADSPIKVTFLESPANAWMWL